MRLLWGVKCTLWLTLGGLGHGALSDELIEAPAAAPSAEQPLTAERVDLLRKAALESANLDAEIEKKLADIYRSAQAEVQRATELAARAVAFKTDAEAVDQRLALIKQQLEKMKGKEPLLRTEETLTELEQLLAKLEPQLTAHKKAQGVAEAEPTARAQRRKEILGRLLAVPEQLREVQQQAGSPPANEHPLVLSALKTDLAARQMALEREVPALENELAKYDAEEAVGLVRLQRDLCTQQVALAEQHLQQLKAQIEKARTVAAEQAVRKARDEAIAADPVLKSYAERNRDLAEVTQSIAKRFNASERDLKAAEEVYAQLHRQFDETRKKVDSIGLKNSVGALLRKERAALPDVRKRRAAISNRRQAIDDTQYELFEYDDERQVLANPDVLVQTILAKAELRRAQHSQLLEATARDVLDRKREYLDSLIRNHRQYFDTLLALDTIDQQIITLSEQYQQYLDERVLWIRSGNLLTSEFRLDQSDVWFVSAQQWADVTARLWGDLNKNPVLYGLVLLIFAVLLARGKGFRNELRTIGETVQRSTCRDFGPTLRAVVLTIAVAAVWPVVIGFVAWRLNVAANGAPFVKAVAHGLACLCAMWFPLGLFSQICRPQGLAEAHFGWPHSATQLLRRNLRWLILLVLPLTFVTATFVASDPTHGRDAVERTCFILHAIVLAVFLRRLLHPLSGVFQEYIAYHRGGWTDRLKYVWYWLGVSGPLVLAGLAFWGFFYTAQVLSWRLYTTMSFLISLVLVRALLLRLILLRRRKLSIEQARERAAAAALSGEPIANQPPVGIVTDQPQSDLSAQSLQTQRMLTTGMLATALVGFWLIWVDVLPALSILDQWPLWTTATSVQIVEANATPATRPMQPMALQDDTVTALRTKYQTTSITISDVALAVLISVITCMSARNVPGLLEMSVLQRLPLDASVRYAITTLVSYAIVMLGVVVACSNIGLRWSQIQWLATALTFGLAFGLQEIFANFVAGLIILFERPVRVGDVVTVDDVTGVVSRIRIRATSITNWDRKEYVVPNKEFITGRLLNWTLSDRVNRIVITVGIAYGSDTERAKELLLMVANEHPLIMKDPPSLATFEGFGDNALNFTLRTYLPNMDNRLQVIHELHTAIDRAFQKAGIAIAFPQRDLHIRSLPEALAVATPHLRRQGDGQQEAA